MSSVCVVHIPDIFPFGDLRSPGHSILPSYNAGTVIELLYCSPGLIIGQLLFPSIGPLLTAWLTSNGN